MNNICIFEDENYVNLYPLIYFRPVFELITGMKTLRERIILVSEAKEIYYLCRDYLKPTLIEKLNLQPTTVNSIPNNKNILFINGRLILNQSFFSEIRQDKEEIGVMNNTIVYASLNSNTISQIKNLLTSQIDTKKILDRLKDKVLFRNIPAQLIEYPWDLINSNSELLEQDFINPKIEGFIDEKTTIYGDKNKLHIGKNSRVEANVLLNLESGPIYIDDNVTIRPPTIIDGPCYIGKNTLIDGAKIRPGVYIGETCKIAGEIEESIINNFTNKHHEGFLGHAYICEWVNIGAGTNNSDLKNTYGTVKVIINKKEIDTNSIKVGCFIGDHTKLGIGVMLTTGCTIGPFCNIFRAGLQSKDINSFSWTDPKDPTKFTEYQLDKAMETARRMMKRRKIKLSKNYEELIRKVKEITQ